MIFSRIVPVILTASLFWGCSDDSGEPQPLPMTEPTPGTEESQTPAPGEAQPEEVPELSSEDKLYCEQLCDSDCPGNTLEECLADCSGSLAFGVGIGCREEIVTMFNCYVAGGIECDIPAQREQCESEIAAFDACYLVYQETGEPVP